VRLRIEGSGRKEFVMKKILFGALAAATVIASATAVSAQTRTDRAIWNEFGLVAPQGEASPGYQMNIKKADPNNV
jgi:hypothetical protein